MNNYYKKVNNVSNSIKAEGLGNYLDRLHSLGTYRLWAKKLLNKKLLQNSTAMIHGHEMQLPERKGGLVEEVLLYGTHEPIATEVYSSYLQPGMKILEVGTNIGYYLAVADQKIGSSGMIMGFEPDLEAYDCAIQNSQALKSSVKIHNIAASDKEGEATFFQSELSNWGSLVEHEDLKLTSSLNVRTTTIDKFCDEAKFQPDVIRMDIEGAEIKALQGALDTLSKHKPTLFIEFHHFMMTPEQVQTFLEILGENGYKDFALINRYYDFPWASKEAKKRSQEHVTLEGLTEFSTKSNASPVFSIITQHPAKAENTEALTASAA